MHPVVNAAVPVIRVLAETDIDDRDEIQVCLYQQSERLGHGTLWIPRLRPAGILGLGETKENEPGDSGVGETPGIFNRLVGRDMVDTRQGGDFLSDTTSRNDKSHADEVLG